MQGYQKLLTVGVVALVLMNIYEANSDVFNVLGYFVLAWTLVEILLMAKRISDKRLSELHKEAKLEKGERRIYSKKMLTALNPLVIGQALAKETIAKKLQARSAVPPDKRDKPLGTFFEVGSTGTGKSHLAKMVAKVLKRPLFKINGGSITASYLRTLLGSERGIAGMDETGTLIDFLETTGGHGVLLIDEIEKIIEDPSSPFAQFCLALFDEGIVVPGNPKSGSGENTLARNLIIIATSNAEHEAVVNAGLKLGPDLDSRIKTIMLRRFAPEFFERVDAFIPFLPFSDREIATIVELEVERFADKYSLVLDTSETAVHEEFWKAIWRKSEVSKDGMRTFKRWVENLFETEFVRAMDAGYHVISIDFDGERYHVEPVSKHEQVEAKVNAAAV